jgi:signal transduction histidine kinase
VDVTVADSGPGIPEELKEKIFDPFFTTRSMGTGLGLSISRQIAREHGGNLTVRNASQGGAVFKFSLPAVTSAAEEETK